MKHDVTPMMVFCAKSIGRDDARVLEAPTRNGNVPFETPGKIPPVGNTG